MRRRRARRAHGSTTRARASTRQFRPRKSDASPGSTRATCSLNHALTPGCSRHRLGPVGRAAEQVYPRRTTRSRAPTRSPPPRALVTTSRTTRQRLHCADKYRKHAAAARAAVSVDAKVKDARPTSTSRSNHRLFRRHPQRPVATSSIVGGEPHRVRSPTSVKFPSGRRSARAARPAPTRSRDAHLLEPRPSSSGHDRAHPPDRRADVILARVAAERGAIRRRARSRRASVVLPVWVRASRRYLGRRRLRRRRTRPRARGSSEGRARAREGRPRRRR